MKRTVTLSLHCPDLSQSAKDSTDQVYRLLIDLVMEDPKQHPGFRLPTLDQLSTAKNPHRAFINNHPNDPCIIFEIDVDQNTPVKPFITTRLKHPALKAVHVYDGSRQFMSSAGVLDQVRHHGSTSLSLVQKDVE